MSQIEHIEFPQKIGPTNCREVRNRSKIIS